MTEAAARSERGVALVTGGARRIGRAICLKLAQAGFDVAIHHHASGDDARTLADEIAALGRRACLLQADLTDEASPCGVVLDLPAIPGLNDTRENMKAMAEFMHSIGLKDLKYLNFHKVSPEQLTILVSSR